MIKVYVLDTEPLRQKDFSSYVDSLPFGDTEKTRLLAIHNSNHKWESLGGLIALSRLLDKFPIDAPISTEIYRSAAGKPYFNAPAAPFFSISHSKGIAAAAMVEYKYGEIGFDIETVDVNYNFERISQRCFTEKEITEINESKNPAEAFFSLWTAKEAMAKIDGGGLSSIITKRTDKPMAPTHIRKLSMDFAGQRTVMSVCSYVADQAVQIFTDKEV